MNSIEKSSQANSRQEVVASICNEAESKRILEIGVYKGDMAAFLLEKCPCIKDYYMLDPWRKLEDWNKPANKENDEFEQIFNLAMDRTKTHETKRNILRGTTLEMIHELDDKSIDLAYVDGDHTLRGITLDLIAVWPKIHDDGFIIGDDFSSTIWQHHSSFEPTLVFPWAVHFAEAHNRVIMALPFNQFIILKNSSKFEFIDLTDEKYVSKLEIGSQLQLPITQAKDSVGVKQALQKKWPFLKALLS